MDKYPLHLLVVIRLKWVYFQRIEFRALYSSRNLNKWNKSDSKWWICHSWIWIHYNFSLWIPHNWFWRLYIAGLIQCSIPEPQEWSSSFFFSWQYLWRLDVRDHIIPRLLKDYFWWYVWGFPWRFLANLDWRNVYIFWYASSSGYYLLL